MFYETERDVYCILSHLSLKSSSDSSRVEQACTVQKTDGYVILQILTYLDFNGARDELSCILCCFKTVEFMRCKVCALLTTYQGLHRCVIMVDPGKEKIYDSIANLDDLPPPPP